MPHLCSSYFCFSFTVSLSFFFSLSLVSSIANQASSFPACQGPLKDSQRENTHQPFYPPFLLNSSQNPPNIFYIYRFSLTLSPSTLHFPLKRLDFCLALPPPFLICLWFSEFLLAHLRPQPSSSTCKLLLSSLQPWLFGHLGFGGFLLFQVYIGLSMLVESLLAKKEPPFLLLWVLKEEDQGV